MGRADLKRQLEKYRRELAEAREQQRATAEILGVISSLPVDVQPVFDTIVRNFVLLCGSVFGGIYTFDGELVHFAGAYGFTPERGDGTLFDLDFVESKPVMHPVASSTGSTVARAGRGRLRGIRIVSDRERLIYSFPPPQCARSDRQRTIFRCALACEPPAPSRAP